MLSSPDAGADTGLALRSFLIDVDSLPSPPALLFEILDYTATEDLSIHTLGNLVGRDASLTAKLLQMANSSIYSFPGEIASIERAVMVLGIKSVRLLTLSLTLTGLFPRSLEYGDAVMEVRRRSLVNALANRAFMAEIDPIHADEGFIVGLLSNVGALVVEQCSPDDFVRLFGDSITSEGMGCRLAWPTAAMQRDVLGFTLDELSAELLNQWGLPDFLVDVIGHREEPAGTETEDDGIEGDQVFGRLRLSIRLSSLAEEVLCGQPDGNALSQLTERASAELDLPRERIETLLIELGPVIAETSGLFGVELAAGVDFSDVVARSAEAMHRLSVEAITMLSHQAEHLADLERQNEALARDSRVDSLTGLSNRVAFDEGLETQVAIRRRRSMSDSLALMLFDIDDLGGINDRLGHQMGDSIVRHIALLLAGNCRSGEDFFRIGGEEFALLIPHASIGDLGGAGERFRLLVERTPFVSEPDGDEISATVTIGAAIAEEFDDPDVAHFLVQSAYQQLYVAKKAGRNQSSVQTRPSP